MNALPINRPAMYKRLRFTEGPTDRPTGPNIEMLRRGGLQHLIFRGFGELRSSVWPVSALDLVLSLSNKHFAYSIT